MKIKFLFLFSFALILFSGCDVAKQVGGAYNMVNCKYEFNSVSGLNVGGIDFSQGLSLANMAQATNILSGRATSIPMDFTLNLDVTNPNQSAALLNGLDYILSIDDIQFTTGSLSQRLNIPAGDKAVLPLTIGFDLTSLLKGETKDAVLNITKNFIGIGQEKSNVSLQIRPTFLIGEHAVPSPAYIPVSFAFGGNK